MPTPSRHIGHAKAPSNNAIIKYINEQTGIGVRDVRDVLRGTIHYLSEKLIAGEEVGLYGFGIFRLKTRKGRTTTYTNHRIYGNRTFVMEDTRHVRFKASKVLKEKINPKKK